MDGSPAVSPRARRCNDRRAFHVSPEMALMSNILPLVAKAWPIAVGICGAIWFGAHGDWHSALGALGLGSAATATSQYLHQVDPKGS